MQLRQRLSPSFLNVPLPVGAIRNPFDDIEDEVREQVDLVEDPCYDRYFVQDPVSFIRNDLWLDKDNDNEFADRMLAYAE